MRAGAARGADVPIISADKDLMQLIGPGVADVRSGLGRCQEQDLPPRAAHRPRRGDRLFRRAAREGHRRAGAGRRFDRQRAGRARHRHQDRGAAHPEYGDLETLLARAGEIKQPKRREALTESPRRRADPAVEEARDPAFSDVALDRSTISGPPPPIAERRSSPSSRRWNSPRSPAASPSSTASRPAISSPMRALKIGPAAGDAPQWRRSAGEPSARRGSRRQPKRRRKRRRRRSRADRSHPGPPGPPRRAARKRGAGQDRPLRLRDHDGLLEKLDALDRRGLRGGRRRHRHRDVVARSDAGRARRRIALRSRPAAPAMPARPSLPGRDGGLFGGAGLVPGQLAADASSPAQAAAGRYEHPQDRSEPETCLAGARAARHRDRALSTTRC